MLVSEGYGTQAALGGMGGQVQRLEGTAMCKYLRAKSVAPVLGAVVYK